MPPPPPLPAGAPKKPALDRVNEETGPGFISQPVSSEACVT